MKKFVFSFTKIKDVYTIEPVVHSDYRGYFMETYNFQLFQEFGINTVFVQDNQSCSKQGVIRGLHFQKTKQQAKLVRITKGEVFDVCVDLRKDSQTFGQWESVILSDENKRQLYIPKGFAHGFMVLSDFAELNYKCSDFYDPLDQDGILWNDADLAINWPIEYTGGNLVLSEKDKNLLSLKEFKEIHMKI